jgi:hypothetical protein
MELNKLYYNIILVLIAGSRVGSKGLKPKIDSKFLSSIDFALRSVFFIYPKFSLVSLRISIQN